MEGLLARVFERYPRRYAAIVVAGIIPFCLLATTMGLATLTLVFQGSFRQFAQLVVPGTVLSSICVVVTYMTVWNHLEPVFRWLGGERDADVTAAVWHVLNDMLTIVRRGVFVFCAAYAAFPLYVIRVLDLPLYAYAGILMGVLTAIAWAAMMIVLWLDYALRPAIKSGYLSSLPPTFEPVPSRLSARRKLLLSSTVFATANISLCGGIFYGLNVEAAIALPIFVAIALVASFTVARVGNTFIALSMFGPVEDLIAASRAVGAGDLTARVAVQQGDEFGMLSHSFNQMVRGLAEREALRSALGSYVEPHIADRVLTEGELLDGAYVDVTLLFLDLRGFTTKAELQDAADTVYDLNVIFGHIVPLVAEHGGHVNKFMGDGLLAVFGTPEYHVDHADRALAAARAIAATMSERVPDGFGIGINSGKVVAGTIGGGGHLEFAVIGDAVNVASRVEGLTKEFGDTVLVTGETRMRLDGSTDLLISRGSHVVRGRSEPIEIYALEV